MITYAQNFEDFMLWRALKNVKNGFYIDVGACDPCAESVTKWFYDNGWSGVNIEPIEECYEKFLIERPKDVNLNFFVSDKEGETDFYESSDLLRSTSKIKNIEAVKNDPNFKFKKKIKTTKKLDDICAKYNVKTIHFLKIDVEGSETEVLRGFSFDTIRPWIVLIETASPYTDHKDISLESCEYLNNKGYHCVYFDGLNKFFIANERKKLDNAFYAPLNVFDYGSIKLTKNHFLIINTEFADFANQLQQKDQEVANLNKEVANLNKEVANLNKVVQQKDQEIVIMKSSKFWKLRKKYINLKSKLKM